jgi:hypothetical protein
MATDRNDNDEPPDSARAAALRPGERRRAPSARELALRAELIQVRHELKTLLDDLHKVAVETESPMQSAVVTSVVARTSLIPHPRRG